MYRSERHPLNAAGDFYVEYGTCTACDAPRREAPELIDYDSDGHCYFKRQPQTLEEVAGAISAVHVSCVEAVLYAGNDPDILAKLNQPPCRIYPNTPPETLLNKLEDWVLRFLRRVLDR